MEFNLLLQDDLSPVRSDFETVLVEYLEACGTEKCTLASAIAICGLHDFSSARGTLIPSTPGMHDSTVLLLRYSYH